MPPTWVGMPLDSAAAWAARSRPNSAQGAKLNSRNTPREGVDSVEEVIASTISRSLTASCMAPADPIRSASVPRNHGSISLALDREAGHPHARSVDRDAMPAPRPGKAEHSAQPSFTQTGFSRNVSAAHLSPGGDRPAIRTVSAISPGFATDMDRHGLRWPWTRAICPWPAPSFYPIGLRPARSRSAMGPRGFAYSGPPWSRIFSPGPCNPVNSSSVKPNSRPWRGRGSASALRFFLINLQRGFHFFLMGCNSSRLIFSRGFGHFCRPCLF